MYQRSKREPLSAGYLALIHLYFHGYSVGDFATQFYTLHFDVPTRIAAAVFSQEGPTILVELDP